MKPDFYPLLMTSLIQITGSQNVVPQISRAWEIVRNVNSQGLPRPEPEKMCGWDPGITRSSDDFDNTLKLISG